jgi:hypothetical protein
LLRLAAAALRMRDRGVRCGHVRLDLDVALAPAQVLLERERSREVRCAPVGQAQPAPAVERAMHEPLFAAINRCVYDRPGIGDRPRATIEREQRPFVAAEVRQRQLDVVDRALGALRQLAQHAEDSVGAGSARAQQHPRRQTAPVPAR